MKNITIFIVDDHRLFREGLKLILSGLSYVQEVIDLGSGMEYLELLDKKVPDITFMDIEMPEMDGVQTTSAALLKYPELKIVTLSMHSDAIYYRQMIQAGAKGFLVKNSDIEEVEETIGHIMAGKSYISPEIINNLLLQQNETPSCNLTEREVEVLHHICKGLSNHQIADTLNLSKRTIDKHRENILSKTNANNTAGLVMYAIREGIIKL